MLVWKFLCCSCFWKITTVYASPPHKDFDIALSFPVSFDVQLADGETEFYYVIY